MAIKFSSTQKINIPNKDKYISISGGWDAAPTMGGIITFNGKASMVGGSPPGDTIILGDLGTFYVTSVSTDDYLGYTKVNISFSCILGFLTKTKVSVPLGACIYRDSTLNSVISSLCKISGLNFSIQGRGDSTKLHEPVWIKENQSIISLINEILTANGCILYSENGTDTKCETISNFFRNLGGSSNSNTISKNFVIDRGSSGIKSVEISGTKSRVEDLGFQDTITTGNKTTTIERILPSISSGGMRKITTTTIDKDAGTKSIIIEEFENAPPYSGGSSNPNVPIKDCYPHDPARITSRSTELYMTGSNFEKLARSCIKEYTNSCNAEKEPTAIISTPGYVIVEKKEEKWVYDTFEDEIVVNPDLYSPKMESVKYTKDFFKNPAYENISNCNLTYGNTFEFLNDPDDADKIKNQFFHKKAVKAYQSLVLIETEEINWSKQKGSYRWEGEKVKKEAYLRTKFEERKAFMKEFKKAIEGGYESFDLVKGDYTGVSPIYQVVDVSSWEFQDFNTNFTSFQSAMEAGVESMEPTEEEIRIDWEPEYTTAPPSYRVHNIPWQDRVNGGNDNGEVVSISAGRFNDYSTVKSLAGDLIKASNKRKKSLAITNINEIFKVGEIDAPSFSIDANGIKSSGVYLNDHLFFPI